MGQTDLMVAVTPNLDTYTNTVLAIPSLTLEEEIELGKRHVATGDLQAARQLILSHLKMVIKVSRDYSGYGLPQEDLIQEGNIGLMKAVKNFDPDKGARLCTFAIHWVKAAIHEYVLSNWKLVKLATTKAQRKLFFNLRSMKKGTGALKPAEAETIAAKLDVPLYEVYEMERRMGVTEITIEGDTDSESDTPSYTAPIHWLASPYASIEYQEAQAEHEHRIGPALQDALASLDERSRHIVTERWLREDGGATLSDLSKIYNLSMERVRQIEKTAFAKLKVALA